MWELLDFFVSIFKVGQAENNIKKKRKEFAEKSSISESLNSKSYSEVLDWIELNKMKIHKKGLSIEEAFEWFALPKLIEKNSEEEIEALKEQFRLRFESSEMLNAFHPSINFGQMPTLGMILGITIGILVVIMIKILGWE
jgi:hypothetical protein